MRTKTIGGQEWEFESLSYWSPDVMGGTQQRIWRATRLADGRTCQGKVRERLERVIAERIAGGIY